MRVGNKKKNIREELARASDCLKEADALYGEGLHTGAVSRLYYYVLHAVKALLLAKGFEPKSHEGTLRLLGMHFIKSGIFDPSISHIFTRLMKYREEADYNPSYFFTKDDYVQFRKDAEALYGKVVEFLAKEGLT